MSESNLSIASRYRETVPLVQSNPQEAVEKLEGIQTEVAAVALFSSNETIDDVSTSSLALLSLDHHIALAYAAVPTTNAKERKTNLTQAMNHFSCFLERLDQLEVLPDDRKKEFVDLLQTNLDEPSTFPSVNRDEKFSVFDTSNKSNNRWINCNL
ncbi:TAP42-like family [Fragilaria crotonensis]|nr:TAP42-like family [Fragilaria crotonensis]